MAIRQREIKSIPLNVKDLDETKGIVAFYYAAWTKDLYKDVVRPGSYDKTVVQNKANIFHDRDHTDACGTPLEFGADEKGAYCVSQLALKTIVGNDTYEQYKAGLVKGHSHEYEAIVAYPESDGGRTIKEMRLWGVTTVTKIPVNLDTPTIGIKSVQDVADHMKKINDLLHNGNPSDHMGELFCREYKRLAAFMETKSAELAKAGIVHCENCKTIILDEAPETKCTGCGRFINSKTGKVKPLIDKNFIDQFKL